MSKETASFENSGKKELAPEENGKEKYREQLLAEFDRQVENLTDEENSREAGVNPEEIREILEPLREKIEKIAERPKKIKEGHIPFLVVIKNNALSGDKAMHFVEFDGKDGYTTMNANEVGAFKPVEGIDIPGGKAYLALDIETGKDTLGDPLEKAVEKIKKASHPPLTEEEGVALAIHHPEKLKNNGVWAPGSRRAYYKDTVVPAFWLVAGAPRLDWDYEYSHYADWGSASCNHRVGH